jgi:hypothetical protein
MLSMTTSELMLQRGSLGFLIGALIGAGCLASPGRSILTWLGFQPLTTVAVATPLREFGAAEVDGGGGTGGYAITANAGTIASTSTSTSTTDQHTGGAPAVAEVHPLAMPAVLASPIGGAFRGWLARVCGCWCDAGGNSVRGCRFRGLSTGIKTVLATLLCLCVLWMLAESSVLEYGWSGYYHHDPNAAEMAPQTEFAEHAHSELWLFWSESLVWHTHRS